MKLVSVEIRKEIVKYYQNHNTAQTAECFSLSKESVLRYIKHYDGTDQSLIDRRIIKTSRSYSEQETALLQISLEKYNEENRKRNVITPTYTELYCSNTEYVGRRSYAAVCKKARKLIGRRERKNKRPGKTIEHKRYHGAKEPGTIQIDKLYVPYACFREIASSPTYLEAVKAQIISDEKRICHESVLYYQTQAARNDALKQTYLFLCKEFLQDSAQMCEQIRSASAKELLDQRFYQYTAIDECTRWCFRMMFNTQNEMASMQFLMALIEKAPFTIKMVQTDNGSEFTSKYLKNHGADYETPFEVCLQATRIKYHRIPPGKPWQNGRVECQHRLDKERFYAHLKMISLKKANETLERYNQESNRYKRHCLDGMSAEEKLRSFQA